MTRTAQPIVIFGGGDHARVVWDTINNDCNSKRYYEVMGYVASEPSEHYSELNYIGTDDEFFQKTDYHKYPFIVAIGDNRRRQEVFLRCKAAGLKPNRAIIHPFTSIGEGVSIGNGSIIMAGAVIQPGVVIGDNSIINTSASVDHGCEIGQYAHIAPGAHLAGNVTIGDGVFVGAGATIIPKIVVGYNAVIAAGTVVHKDVTGHKIYIRPKDGRKRNVLIYAPVVGRGGVARLVQLMSHALTKVANPELWSFTVLSHRKDENWNPINWPASFNFIQLQPAQHPRHPDLFAYLSKMQSVFHEQLTDVAKNHDVIWLPHPWWTMREGWPTDKPTVATIPDFAFDHIEFCDQALRFGFRLEAQAFARNCVITCFPSEFQRQWGIQEYNFVNTHAIHYAWFLPDAWWLSESEKERVKRKYNLPDHYVLAFHLPVTKDPATVVRGQALARATSPKVPPLVMAGIGSDDFRSDGRSQVPGIADVQAEIKRQGFRHGRDLFVLGAIPDEDIAGLYMGASAAVTASRSEGGLSATIFEAVSSRTPLIHSDLPVFTERFGNDSKCGLSFKVGDYEGLACALVQRYTEHPTKSTIRADRAYDLLNARSWAEVARDYLNIWAEACG